MNWFELSVKVGAYFSVPVSLPTIYFQGSVHCSNILVTYMQ